MYSWLNVDPETVVVIISDHDDESDIVSSIPSVIVSALFTIFNYKPNMIDAFTFCQSKR